MQTRSPVETRPPRMQPLSRLPVFYALEDKRVLVAGGSAAAAWKAELLSAAGAQVDIYAPDPCDELLALAGVTAPPAPERGLFRADSWLRRVSAESVLLLGGGRALLLEVAHPLVAAGVARHSRFREDPLGRLQHHWLQPLPT